MNGDTIQAFVDQADDLTAHQRACLLQIVYAIKALEQKAFRLEEKLRILANK